MPTKRNWNASKAVAPGYRETPSSHTPYPVPPKPDGRLNPSFGFYAEAPLTEGEIEELKNRDTRDPEEIATDEEQERCIQVIRSYIGKHNGMVFVADAINLILERIIKEIKDGAETPAPSSD